MPPPGTPDGRYLVVRGRLWRAANPSLAPERLQELVGRLMALRRACARLPRGQRGHLHPEIQAVKELLGERGPPWWEDGSPDENRRLARNSSYAEWWAGLSRD
jgi:hypothetical protein